VEVVLGPEDGQVVGIGQELDLVNVVAEGVRLRFPLSLHDVEGVGDGPDEVAADPKALGHVLQHHFRLFGRLEAVVESELTADEVQLDGWIAGKGKDVSYVTQY
jgi:hypothetical protein